ncbi:LRR receptor-like serine/threonine-protein kinase GSO1 [Vitis vinifera]|uniref:LRR receptor-like serine/threonine-protein kinase GSO1 n=1 Tax=Vitis vinifera TaxID=29760 RepID=A0A438IRJ8_VITVI|nr:LRR receptor-like serine/threonine-protein kinase GSO1 [Vitis vinifera]
MNDLYANPPQMLNHVRNVIAARTGNSLTGSVPAELSLCKKLTHIDLNNNFLSGPIPSWLESLPNLGELKLSFNLFSGPLPHELFKCSNLLVLSLDNNLLNGTLPLETGNLASLNVLNLNQNQFYGPIPPAIGNLSKLYELRLSRNSFNGEIPIELGELQNLQSVLDLGYNNLTGEIPHSIGTLSKLEALDLSHNQLVGEIPFQVGAMSSLGKLNFSYNNLEGKLDKEFLHWPAETFMGNLRLCGEPLGRCNSEESSHHNSGLKLSSMVIISAFSTIAAIVLLMIGVALFLKGKRESLNEVKCVYSSSSSIVHRRPLLPNTAGKRDFKWGDIMQAINNLSDNFIIGSGGSGTIYKAELSSEEDTEER